MKAKKRRMRFIIVLVASPAFEMSRRKLSFATSCFFELGDYLIDRVPRRDSNGQGKVRS